MVFIRFSWFFLVLYKEPKIARNIHKNQERHERPLAVYIRCLPSGPSLAESVCPSGSGIPPDGLPWVAPPICRPHTRLTPMRPTRSARLPGPRLSQSSPANGPLGGDPSQLETTRRHARGRAGARTQKVAGGGKAISRLTSQPVASRANLTVRLHDDGDGDRPEAKGNLPEAG